MTAMQAACQRNQNAVVQWLCTLPGVEVGSAFLWACAKNKEDLAKQLYSVVVERPPLGEQDLPKVGRWWWFLVLVLVLVLVLLAVAHGCGDCNDSVSELSALLSLFWYCVGADEIPGHGGGMRQRKRAVCQVAVCVR